MAPYGSFVLGLTVPITTIANPIPGRSIAARHDLDHQPHHDQRVQLGLHPQLDSHRRSRQRPEPARHGINLPVLYPSACRKTTFPNVTFNGTRINASPGFGTGDAPFINYNTTIDIIDNLTKVWGTHTIKAGVYMQRSRKDQTSFANFNGSYNFGDNPCQPVRHRLRILQRAAGRLQHIHQASQPHQRSVPLLEHRTVSCRTPGRSRRA